MINFEQQKITTIFFDMDGVLVDSMPMHVKSWVGAFQSVGMPFDPYTVYLNEGRTGASTIHLNYLKHFGREATADEVAEIYAANTQIMVDNHHQIPPVKGMQAFVSFVKSQGYDLWIVTGSSQKSLFDKINHMYPNCFERHKMVTGADVRFGKPHPEPYLKAIAKSGCKAEHSVVIENAPLGVQSAVAAGLQTLAINTGILESALLSDAGASFVFNNTSELQNWWKLNCC